MDIGFKELGCAHEARGACCEALRVEVTFRCRRVSDSRDVSLPSYRALAGPSHPEDEYAAVGADLPSFDPKV